MRVLFPFVGDTLGGSHISSYQLICSLREFGVEPIILLHQKEGKLAPWLAKLEEKWHLESLPILRLDSRSATNALQILRGLGKASKVLRKLEIDLVHGNDTRINRAWSIWAKWANIPMVWHQRSVWKKLNQKSWTLSTASGIISISKYVAATLPSSNSPHVTIYNPITKENRDLKTSAITLRNELGLEKNSRIIGCFANAQSWKRPDTFVKVARICNREIPDLKFVWFGNDYDGSLTNAMEQDSQLSSTFNITHCNFREDVLSAMAGCDVLVATSESEPFGRTIVEAMSLGVPVVASDAGGHKEIIHHQYNGLLFPVGDANSCASEIMRVLQKQELRSCLIENGLTSAEQFAPQKHGQQVLAFYKSVTGLSQHHKLNF